MDPPNTLSDKEVQRILSLNNVVIQLPDTFSDYANVIRSNILTANVPAWTVIPMRHHAQVQNVAPVILTVHGKLPLTVQSTVRPKKIGRSVSSNDVLPR